LTLEQFIEDALCSISNDKTYTLNITKEACEAIKKHTNLNICKYKFIIEESYVRHVRNNHPEDLYLLYKVPIILNSFSHVEKSITPNKQTKQNEVSLVFKKTLEDGTIKMVALRIIRGNILSLKTFYRP
jgi:hypothetical protein